MSAVLRTAAGKKSAVLLGRESEIAILETALSAARDGRSETVVLRGEPGIGKTALLEEAAGLADEVFLVLRTAGVQSEAELPYAGLHQLLQPIVDSLGDLPEPQRKALGAAFGLEATERPDRLLVGMGTLTLLSSAADNRPLLLLVDDAQWLDSESLDAIAFVLRRTTAEPIAAVVAVREGEGRSVSLPAMATHRLLPLEVQEARRLLSEAYGANLAGDAAETLLQNAAGNPLALVELGHTLATGGDALASVEQTYAAQLSELPLATQLLLLLAACDDEGSVALTSRAGTTLGVELSDLEPAERARLVQVANGRIRFKHPLARSAAYKAAPLTQRQTAHLALAETLSDPSDTDRRAWHRAAAAIEPDEEVARELESTASRAQARAGYAAAASALARAAELSENPAERARRLVEASESARLAGQYERAVALASAAEIPEDEVRLEAQRSRIRGVIEMQTGSPATALRIFLDAARAVHRLDPRAALDLALHAQEAAGLAGAVDEIVELGEWGQTFATGNTPEEEIMIGLLRGFTAIASGDRSGAKRPLDQAARLGNDVSDPRLLVWSGTAAMFLGEDRRTFNLLKKAVTVARSEGAVGSLPFALHLLAGVERRLGNLEAAEADADESLRLANETSQQVVAAGALSTLTALAAFRGKVEEAEEYARQTMELARPRGLAVALAGTARALAELDLAQGRAEEALERLVTSVGLEDERLHQPYALYSVPLYVEVAVRANRAASPAKQLAAFEQWVEEGELHWARPLIARSRALIARSEAETDALYQSALNLHETYSVPFETARTQLLYGEHLRRTRRKSESRVLLREAAETLDALGARLWAARANAELRATGATARKRTDSTRDDLTPQELQIVRLVSQGKTNPETAAALFLSPKTVQYHLRKVFIKLEIASRSDLIRMVAEGSIPGAREAA